MQGPLIDKLVFSPCVVVQCHFCQNGQTTVETRAAPTLATCPESEYNEYMTSLSTVETQNRTVKDMVAPSIPLSEENTLVEDAQCKEVPEPLATPTNSIGKVCLSPAPL